VAVVFFFSEDARNIMHIPMDVINHFERVGATYPVRARIAHRFQSVLSRMMKDVRPTHLLVIAHSQGTVIALDQLRAPAVASQLDGLQSVRLLTFGSPFSHIYQLYFPRQYHDLADAAWKLWQPAPGGRAWTNLFRIDDYVGTNIVNDADPHWPDNTPLPVGGHLRYWQKDAFDQVSKLLPP
jgi:hypothetical protein